MPTGKPTPEEKLLHIIENPREIDKLERKKKRERPATSNDILSKGIFLAGTAITVAVVFYFVNGEMVKKPFLQITEHKEIAPPVSSTNHASIEVASVPEEPLYVEEAAAVEIEAPINLKLVGIIWSKRNAEAIIEEKASRKTYLVSKGDAIDKFLIEDITRSEVKLVSEDGEKILR